MGPWGLLGLLATKLPATRLVSLTRILQVRRSGARDRTRGGTRQTQDRPFGMDNPEELHFGEIVMRLSRAVQLLVLPLICASITLISCAKKETVSKPAPERASVKVNWDNLLAVSKTVPTLQVVVMPPLRRGAKIHDRVFQAVHELGADYVRYVPWLPYPKLAVAELDPPKDRQTSWDFSLIDPMMEDFMNATAGHSVVVNFSTIPQWMFKTEKPVPYPADPDELTWTYEQGKELRDPSRKELADYYARLVSWYTQGGFTDEAGKRHQSGHHYKIDYWEVFNEVDDEHSMTPRDYTASYDAIVGAVRQVAPHMKFVSLALDSAENNMQFLEYFLDPRHHRPG